MKRYIDSYYAELELQAWERKVASVKKGAQTREQIATQLWLRGLGNIACDDSLPTTVLQHKLQASRRMALGRRRRIRASVANRTHTPKTDVTVPVAYYLVSELVNSFTVGKPVPANA